MTLPVSDPLSLGLPDYEELEHILLENNAAAAAALEGGRPTSAVSKPTKVENIKPLQTNQVDAQPNSELLIDSPHAPPKSVLSTAEVLPAHNLPDYEAVATLPEKTETVMQSRRPVSTIDKSHEEKDALSSQKDQMDTHLYTEHDTAYAVKYDNEKYGEKQSNAQQLTMDDGGMSTGFLGSSFMDARSFANSLQTQKTDYMYDIPAYQRSINDSRNRQLISDIAEHGNVFEVQSDYISLNSTSIPATAITSKQSHPPLDNSVRKEHYRIQPSWSILLDETKECRLGYCKSPASCQYCIARFRRGPVATITRQLSNGTKISTLQGLLGIRIKRVEEYSGATIYFKGENKSREIVLTGTDAQRKLAEKALAMIGKEFSRPRNRYAMVLFRGVHFRAMYDSLSAQLASLVHKTRILEDFGTLHVTIGVLHTDIGPRVVYDTIKGRIMPEVKKEIDRLRRPITITLKPRDAGCYGDPEPKEFFKNLRAIFEKHCMLAYEGPMKYRPHLTLLPCNKLGKVDEKTKSKLRALYGTFSFGNLEPGSILVSRNPRSCFDSDKLAKRDKFIAECLFPL